MTNSLNLKKTEQNLKLKHKIGVIEAQVDIFDVLDLFSIRHQGRFEQQISCILHKDDTASARVYANTNSYYCFSCGTFLTPIGMTKKMLQATTTVAIDYLIEKLRIVINDENIGENLKKIAEKGDISAYNAYHEIEKMIGMLYKDHKALEKYDDLDYLFYGVDKEHKILIPDYQKLVGHVLS